MVQKKNPSNGVNASKQSLMLRVYETLFNYYGAQHWWPADSPFEVMVGAILVQNTAWTNVEKSIRVLKSLNLLEPKRILSLSQDKLAEHIRSSGYYNVKAKRLQNYCSWYLQQGGFDCLKRRSAVELRESMLGVNGVGYETADDIMLYAFHQLYFVVDAYTKRLFTRLGLVKCEHHSYEIIRKDIEATLVKRELSLYQEYHALIVFHAKTVCKTKPNCQECVLIRDCQMKAMRVDRITC